MKIQWCNSLFDRGFEALRKKCTRTIQRGEKALFMSPILIEHSEQTRKEIEMVTKPQCAWMSSSGYCRWYKDSCDCTSGSCAAFIRPVSEHMRLKARKYMNSLRFDSDGKGACLHPNASRGAHHGWNVYRTCKRKRYFADLNSARVAAISLNRKKGMILAIYECPFCHGYHLTTQIRDSLLLNTIGVDTAA